MFCLRKLFPLGLKTCVHMSAWQDVVLTSLFHDNFHPTTASQLAGLMYPTA